VAALVGLEARARHDGAPLGVLRATFLDVGQGDAALVDLPDGSAILIDGGGLVGSPVDVGTRVLLPLLRQRRRARLRAVVLSHPHPDHVGGLPSVLRAIDTDEVWDTGQGEAERTRGAYAEVIAWARAHATVRGPSAVCGARDIGGARIEVLAPCPGPRVGYGPNDNSFVLRVTYGARAFLFAGDAERAAEHDLLELDRASLRADVLKVGHHGSRTSSGSRFVSAISPSIAVISAGARNRFGHPSPATLDTLRAASVRWLRTDEDGAVTAWTDGAALDARAESGRALTSPNGLPNPLARGPD
jgi:competence protein ComEC